MLYSAWRNISLPTRIKIADLFGIKKHGPTHVRDNMVESDGYLINEVEAALNVDKLQAYLGTDERDDATLIKMLVDKIEGNVDTTSKNDAELNFVLDVNKEEIAESVSKEDTVKIEEFKKKVVRRGRPKKDAKK